MANVIGTHLISSLGDLESTIDGIESGNIHLGTQKAQAVDGYDEVPYYLLQESVASREEGIYALLENIVAKSVAVLDEKQRAETAIIVGTSVIDWNSINAIDTTLNNTSRKSVTKKRSIDSYAKDLSDTFGLNGFTMTINTACTSSANALLEASNLIDAGIYKYVLVVGLEIFSFMLSSGFNALQLLSHKNIQPFDIQRDGTILGEGVAVVLMGNDPSPWKIKGGYSNCEGMNITALSPEGDEVVDVMHNALTQSGIQAKDITALKAHATGTPANDLSELNAIAKVFDKELIFTALKPYIGHTIGACGAMELAILMGCVERGFLPKTHNHTQSIHPSYSPLLEHKECHKGVFMLNYFGFGGNNTSLVVAKEPV